MSPLSPNPKANANARVAHHCWYTYVFIHKTFVTTLKVDLDQYETNTYTTNMCNMTPNDFDFIETLMRCFQIFIE